MDIIPIDKKNTHSIIIISLISIIFFVSILPIYQIVDAQTSEKVLSIGYIQEIDDANPYRGIDDVSYVYYGMIYDYLMRVNEDLEIEGNLATDWWYMSGTTAAAQPQPSTFEGFEHSNPTDWPLGSIWEYNLTENVFWNDGTPFTADDVEWCINLQIGVNYQAFWAYQPYTRWIYKAEAMTDYKVRIFFSDLLSKEPLAEAFGYNLFIPIMPKHIFEKENPTFLGFEWDGAPSVGTGPFMATDKLIEEIIAGERVTLVRNPYFNFEENGVRKGLGAYWNRTTEIDKVLFKFYSEEITLALGIKKGDVDCAEIGAQTFLMWNDENSDKPDTVNIVSMLSPTAYSKVISINAYEDAPGTTNPLRLDPAVKRAAALCVNKSFIIDAIFKGLALPGVSIVSTPVWPEWWWEPGNELSTFYVNDSSGVELFSYSKPMKNVMDYDVVIANQILDAAGYVWTGEVGNSVRKAGPIAAARLEALFGIPQVSTLDETFTFEIVTDYSDMNDREIAQYLDSNWIKIGIDATPDYVDGPTWSKRAYSYTYNVLLTSWSGDIDPNYLTYIPTSYSMWGWNEFGISTEDYDKLYREQAKAFNKTERKYWVDEASKWLYLSGSMITTVYPKVCFAFNENRWTNWGNWQEHPGMSIDAFWGENPLWYSLRYIDSPPAASFTIDEYIGTPNTAFTFDASLSSDDLDPVSSLQVRWDWEDDGIWDTVWTATKAAQHQYSSPGIYTIRLEVKDTGDKTGNTTMQVTVLDDDPPITSASLSGTLKQSDWFVSTVNILLIPSDTWSTVNWTKYQLDGGDWRIYDQLITISENGHHNITFYSADTAGNEEEKRSILFRIDQDVPTLNIFEQNETVFHSSTVTISWSGSDSTSDIDHYEYSLDGSAFISCGNETSIELSNIRDGTHELVIRAIDNSGNTAEQTLTLEVDTSVFNLEGPMGPWLYIIIIIIAAIVVAILLLYMRHRNGGLDRTKSISSESTARGQIEEIPPPPGEKPGNNSDIADEANPESILKLRLARGEISVKEFEKMRKLLNE